MGKRLVSGKGGRRSASSPCRQQMDSLPSPQPGPQGCSGTGDTLPGHGVSCLHCPTTPALSSLLFCARQCAFRGSEQFVPWQSTAGGRRWLQGGCAFTWHQGPPSPTALLC